MPIVAQGSVGTLDAVVTDLLGDAVDWDVLPPPTITVQTPLGVVQAGFPTTVGFVHDGLGLYHFFWTVPLAQPISTYDVRFDGKVAGVDWSGWDSVQVVAAGTLPAGMYCSLADVKVRLAGDVPNMDSSFDASITDIIIDVCDGINSEVGGMRSQSGAASDNYSFLPTAPTTRRYTGYPGGTELLMIDDCVEVASVTLLDTRGNVQSVLTLGDDYLLVPMSTFPIVGLRAISSGICPRWPTYYAGVQVALTPGYGLTIPSDLHDVAITESIRAYMSARAGENDQIGIGPLGTVVTSKAFTDKSRRILNRYAYRAGWFR